MKTRLVILFLFFTCLINGQTVKVKSHSLITSQAKERAFYPVFSPDGTQLLYTSENYQGLNLYDLKTGEVKAIAKEDGAGFAPSFSSDSKKIFYRQVSRLDGRQYKTLMSFDATNKTVEQLSKPVRSAKELNSLQTKEMRKRAASSALSGPSVSVCSENLKIVLCRNGERVEMEPLGPVAGYIWVSLSPNGKMILFTAASKGTFVCDLTGKVVASLGMINAPVWYDNNFVVGMEDKDDGNNITSSSVVIVSLDGQVRQKLTPDDRISMYPTASSASGRIAYCTSNGELYVMELEINH